MTSQGEQLQPELNGGDTLFQQTSIIFGVRRHNFTSKSRIGSSTLISSKIATEKVLWDQKSEEISEEICEEICPLGKCSNYSYHQILLILLLNSSVSSISDLRTENEDQKHSDLS